MTDRIDGRAASRKHLTKRLRAELRIMLVVEIDRTSRLQRAIDAWHLEVRELLAAEPRRRKRDALEKRERTVQMLQDVAADHEIGPQLRQVFFRLEKCRAQFEVTIGAGRAMRIEADETPLGTNLSQCADQTAVAMADLDDSRVVPHLAQHAVDSVFDELRPGGSAIEHQIGLVAVR